MQQLVVLCWNSRFLHLFPLAQQGYIGLFVYLFIVLPDVYFESLSEEGEREWRLPACYHGKGAGGWRR